AVDPSPANNTATAATDVQPTISIEDVTMDEGNAGWSQFNVTVSLSAPPSSTVTMDYATADGTADHVTDYAATSGTLTFGPEDTTQTIVISVIGDTNAESDETIFFNLSNASHAILSD